MTRKPLKVWTSGTTPEGQTLNTYTTPLSRHWVNCKMPQLGVKPETSGFIVHQALSLTAEAPWVGAI